MKKLLTSIIILAIILASSTVVLGAPPPEIITITEKSFNINLNTQTKTVKPGSELEVILNVSDFTGFETSGIIAYVANLEYDKNIFEEVKQADFTSKGTWSSPSYNIDNMAMVSDTNTEVKTNGEVFGLKLKVKDSVAEGTKTTIKVTKFQASDGEEDINAKNDASIEITVLAKTDDTNKDDDTNKGNDNNNGNNSGDQSNNNNNNNGNNSGDQSNNNNNNGNNSGDQSNNNNNNGNNSGNQSNNNNNSGTNNNKGSSTNQNNNSNNNSNLASGKLPQTGEFDWIILISGCAIAIVGIVFLIKYKKAY